jgi:hypothetical protein
MIVGYVSFWIVLFWASEFWLSLSWRTFDTCGKSHISKLRLECGTVNKGNARLLRAVYKCRL